MAPILSAQGLSKRYGTTPLFADVSFLVREGDRIGLIGPNGSGKSTLLGILSGAIEPDSGNVAVRKGTRFSCVPQNSEFAPGETIRYVPVSSANIWMSVPLRANGTSFPEGEGNSTPSAQEFDRV